MSFKEKLKMKFPFTRKGLEDHLNEQLTLMRQQQTEEISTELDRYICDLQQSIESQSGLLFARLKEELEFQFHRKTNDLQQVIESQTASQTEDLFAQLQEEMNLQFHRRINDLQQVIEDQATSQTEDLFVRLKEEINLQFHRRINDLQQAIKAQIENQSEELFTQLKEEINQQFHRRTNDLDRAVTSVKNELYGFFRRFPKTMLSFEVALAEHCNLNCVGCNHFSPLAPPTFANIEEFTSDLGQMKSLFGERVQRIKLLGGEPLLHPNINKFLLVARDCFPYAEIMIVTNGLILPKMDESFWKICKENRIVIEPTKYPVNFDYDAVEQLAKTYEVEYNYFAEKSSTKVFEKYVIDPNGLQDCEGNYRMCFMANSCVHLLHGHLYTCPIAPTAHYLNEAFGTQLRENPNDSIDIYQAKSAEEILEFLAKPIPFCRYCRRDIVVDDIPWRQSKRELSEWTL